MASGADRAKRILWHYLSRTIDWPDPDCRVEIEAIVDDIIEAVIDELDRRANTLIDELEEQAKNRPPRTKPVTP